MFALLPRTTKNTHIFITVAEFQTYHNVSHYFEESHRDMKSSNLHTIIKNQNQTEKKINDFNVVSPVGFKMWNKGTAAFNYKDDELHNFKFC